MSQNVPVTNHTLMILSTDDKALREFFEKKRFLRDKKEFFTQNSVKIDSIHDKMRSLQEKYFVFDGDNIVTEGEGNDKRAKMLNGMLKEDFDKEVGELMGKQNTIKI